MAKKNKKSRTVRVYGNGWSGYTYTTPERAEKMILTDKAYRSGENAITAIITQEQKERDKKAIYRLSSGRCYICGKMLPYEEATVDHVIPHSRYKQCSRPDLIHNVRNKFCCCKDCNLKKRNMTATEFAEFMIDNPNKFPYMTGHRVVRLVNIGASVEKKLGFRGITNG